MGLRIAQQQLIFDRQLQSAVEQSIHFAQLNFKLFSFDEYVLSPVQSAIEVYSFIESGRTNMVA